MLPLEIFQTTARTALVSMINIYWNQPGLSEVESPGPSPQSSPQMLAAFQNLGPENFTKMEPGNT